jgi:hypothetical protein
MAKKYENDFKVMLVELLKSGRKAKDHMLSWHPNRKRNFNQTHKTLKLAFLNTKCILFGAFQIVI